MKRPLAPTVALAVLILISEPLGVPPEPPQTGSLQAGTAVVPATSRPVSSLPARRQESFIYQPLNPRRKPPGSDAMAQRLQAEPKSLDPLLQPQGDTARRTPALGMSFEGIGSSGFVPPDTVGDVGPNHYVQMVNVHFAVYNKNGVRLAGPTAINQLWQGQGNVCAGRNDGDPIVLYDPIADRWILSQFANPNHMCIAVSQTPDPTGTYHLYQFDVGSFPDYFKLGVWPDAYYMSANEAGTTTDYTAYAFDRNNMLAGNPATFLKRSQASSNLLLPSDLDGPSQPPIQSPNYFYTFKDGTAHGGVDRLEVYGFHADFATPANSWFNLLTTIPVAPFNYTVCGFFVLDCVPQADTAQRLDPVSEWPMWRLQYRNFGPHETLVGNFTVDVTGSQRAGIRWFELRKTGGANWTLFQEGTFAPDSLHRWMGSIAMDQQGNIALGYSVSGATQRPAIRYATRLATDLLGKLQDENTLIEGTGVQTFSSRWGDYSSMNVDPVDDCTFWYTNEYYPSGAFGWNTRVGTFKIPTCNYTYYFPVISRP